MTHKKINGFTLIEVLAVVVLLAVVGLAASPWIIKTFGNYQDGITRSSLFKEAQLIESRIIYVARNSTYLPNENSYLKIDSNNPSHYSFYSASDLTEKYAFEWTDNQIIYFVNSSQIVLSQNVIAFSLREEGDTVKKLIYTIKLAKESATGKEMTIHIEEKYIYFPSWSS